MQELRLLPHWAAGGGTRWLLWGLDALVRGELGAGHIGCLWLIEIVQTLEVAGCEGGELELGGVPAASAAVGRAELWLTTLGGLRC